MIFPGAVQGGGIVVDVDMGMGPVNMAHHEKSVATLCPAHSKLIAHIQRILRGNLAGQERLPDLIAQNVLVLLLFPARDGLVPGLVKQKFHIGGHGIALIGADQGAVQGFFWICAIVKTILHGFQDRPAAADVVGL